MTVVRHWDEAFRDQSHSEGNVSDEQVVAIINIAFRLVNYSVCVLRGYWLPPAKEIKLWLIH